MQRGDTVSIYMPMVLELPIAMLACARIGAIHSIVVITLKKYITLQHCGEGGGGGWLGVEGLF